jgi:hypothetical protein
MIAARSDNIARLRTMRNSSVESTQDANAADVCWKWRQKEVELRFGLAHAIARARLGFETRRASRRTLAQA